MQPKSYINRHRKPKLVYLQCNIVHSHKTTHRIGGGAGGLFLSKASASMPPNSQLSSLVSSLSCLTKVLRWGDLRRNYWRAACIIQAWFGRECHTQVRQVATLNPLHQPARTKSSQQFGLPAIIHNSILTYSNIAFPNNLIFVLFLKLSCTTKSRK